MFSYKQHINQSNYRLSLLLTTNKLTLKRNSKLMSNVIRRQFDLFKFIIRLTLQMERITRYKS